MKKTKKALIAAFACTAAVAGAFGLAACNSGENGGGHTHSWNEWTVSAKPTSDSTGKATRTCKNDGCNATSADLEFELPVLTDSGYSTQVTTQATCTTAEVVEYTFHISENETVKFSVTGAVNPDAHAWGPWTVEEANKPTAEAGGKATRTCTASGCTVEADEYTLPALDSEDYEKSADTATCVAGGSVTYTYNKNDVSVSFTVETPKKTEHTWGPWTVEEANKPTAEAGGKATRTCTVDGCTVVAQEYNLPALNETDYEKSEDTATCTDGGTVTYTYNKDGVNVVITVETPVNAAAHGALAHKDRLFMGCDYGGTIEHWECPLCGKLFDAEEGGNELSADDVAIPAGHNYVITVNKENGTATEACANDGCTTGVTKEYKYLEDSAMSTDNTQPVSLALDEYYVENDTSGNKYFRLDLTEAAIYKFDFEHLVPTGNAFIGIVNVVNSAGTSTQVTTSRGTVSSGYENIVSHSRIQGNNNQSASFTFDSTNYVGGHLILQLVLQRQPKIKMSVSKGKTPLKVGSNTVDITEANAMFIDTYEFIPAETKSYSMTVPEGVEVLMNDEDFIVGEDRTVNFDGVADERIVFAFKNSAAGKVTVTIGDAVEKVTLTPDTPIANLTLTGHGVTVIEIGDIEAGKYTVTLAVNRLLTRGAFMYFGKNTSTDYNDYFQANGNTMANSPADVSFQVPMATVLDANTIYSASISGTNYIFTLDLQKGDKLVFVHNGNDTSGNSISMAVAQ